MFRWYNHYRYGIYLWACFREVEEPIRDKIFFTRTKKILGSNRIIKYLFRILG